MSSVRSAPQRISTTGHESYDTNLSMIVPVASSFTNDTTAMSVVSEDTAVLRINWQEFDNLVFISGRARERAPPRIKATESSCCVR
jgi:hypothetical protein